MKIGGTQSCGKAGTTLIALLLFFAASAMAENLERADYKITLPEKSTVDSTDRDIDQDHMTTVNLPNGGTMILLVLDDKKLADETVTNLIASYKGKLKDGIDGKTEAFDKAKAARSAVVSGKMNGIKTSFEVGQFDGKKKTVIVVFTYLERKKAETIEMMQKSLGTFTIKE
jgi:hypothetical protein